MSGNYPGARITRVSAPTFGHVAGMHLTKATAAQAMSLQVARREPVAIKR